jgi:3-oxoacyl-[acyl-carrier protein] reductase
VLGTDLDAWRQAFDSVFVGALRLLRTVADALPDGGAMALVLSTSVREPLANLAISNGLRPGLAMTAKALAGELGPRNVRVVSLLPGAFATDRMLQLVGDDPDAMRDRVAGVPLRRLGTPEEFGRVAAFVLSPAASYLTGTVVSIDGGAVHGL